MAKSKVFDRTPIDPDKRLYLESQANLRRKKIAEMFKTIAALNASIAELSATSTVIPDSLSVYDIRVSNYDPRKARLDLVKQKNQATVLCKHCQTVNHNYYMKCWYCNQQVDDPLFEPVGAIQYKYGNHAVGLRTSRKARDYGMKHGEDMIQPAIYDKSKRDFVDNPDFIKYYGTDRSAHIAEGIEEAIDKGEINLTQTENEAAEE